MLATAKRGTPEFSPVIPDRIRESVEKAANSSVPVLLEGETGTGKTDLARFIHQSGRRASRPFIPVNCAALPPGLIEAELFGRESGAYTDARRSRVGMVEAAHHGTLFLDELGELPFAIQAKLLTVVEGGVVRRIGSTRSTPVNVRIISATNRDLKELVAKRKFREDLYYRCCGMRIELPPLRIRKDDIAEIARRLLVRIVAREQVHGLSHVPNIKASALDVLTSYSWPGNIRQLEHVLMVALLNSSGGTIEAAHLPREVQLGSPSAEYTACAQQPSASRKERYQAPEDPAEERHNIVQALAATGGNRTRAARKLGMSRQVIWERIRFYRIDDDEWRRIGDEEA